MQLRLREYSLPCIVILLFYCLLNMKVLQSSSVPTDNAQISEMQQSLRGVEST